MMEIVASSELEQTEFGKACQSLHLEASSLLDQVTLEWKDHEARLQELERKQRQLEHELSLKETSVDQRLHEVQLKEKDLDSLSQRLESKERDIERQTKELDSKRKHFFKSQVKIEQLEHENDESSTNMDGSSLLLFMNEQLKKIDLAGSRMSAVVQASADPGKLVLDAVRGFYPLNPTVDNLESESNLRSIRKSCILLLQELKRMSPQIDLKVRVEAMKLAAEWKDKMTLAIENSWEVLGFLRLIAAYGCTGICGAGELQSLLAMVEQPEQAAELSRALGITDEAHGTDLNSSIIRIEGPGDSQTGKTAASSMARNAVILSSTNYSLPNEMLASLRLSSDPAKLVLNLIQRSFTQYWTNGYVSSKERVVSSNISLLKLLMRVSKHVGPHLKEGATNLAAQWKAKMIADSENSLESLGFLLFTSIYGLLSTLNEDEIVKLLGRICQHKRSLELCQIHGFADKIADFIGKLIEKNKLIEAVRSLCALKLNDKFPTVPLLKAYVEDAKKWSEVICSLKISLAEKDKAVNGKIADLRAVSQCIKDYNLESEYPSKTVEMQIVQLEILKENWSSSAPSLVSNIEQQEERKRKRPNTSSSAPNFQLGQRCKIRFVCGVTRP